MAKKKKNKKTKLSKVFQMGIFQENCEKNYLLMKKIKYLKLLMIY